MLEYFLPVTEQCLKKHLIPKRTDCSVSKIWELEGKNEMVHMNKLSKIQPD